MAERKCWLSVSDVDQLLITSSDRQLYGGLVQVDFNTQGCEST